MRGRGKGKRQTHYKGWLHKRATKLTSYMPQNYLNPWRWRYCIADDDAFKYYASEPSVSSETLDQAARKTLVYEDIRSVTYYGLVQGRYYNFDVLMNSGHVVSFASFKRDVAKRWVELLRAKLQRKASSKHRTDNARIAQAVATKTPRKEPVPRPEEDYDTELSDDDDADSGVDEREARRSHLRRKLLRKKSSVSRRIMASPDVEKVLGTPENVSRGQGPPVWKVCRLTSNTRVYKQEFPALSFTQSVDEFLQSRPVELKAESMVELDPGLVFRLFMDDDRRTKWDKSVRSITSVQQFDAFKDVVRSELNTPRSMLLPNVVSAYMNRHWWKERNGVYTIIYTTKNQQKVRGVNVIWEYIQIRPNYSSVLQGSCVVVRRMCFMLGVYTDWLKRFLTSTLEDLLVCPISCLHEAAKDRSSLDVELPATLKPRDTVALIRYLRSGTILQEDESAAAFEAEVEAEEEEEKEGKVRLSVDNAVLSASSEIDLDYTYYRGSGWNLVPKAISNNTRNMWWDSGVEKGYWKVRGPNYLVDKVKIPNEVSAMELVQAQLSYGEPVKFITQDPDGLIQQQHIGRRDRPFLFLLNFMVPGLGNYVAYYAMRREGADPETQKKFKNMLKEFIDGDDQYRNSKLKIIPSIVEGSYFARKAIDRPALIAKRIETEYCSGDNCFEVSINVGSSRLAKSLLGLVKGYAATLVVDLAFLFESQTQEELPEILLGGSRVYWPHLDEYDDVSVVCQSKEALEAVTWNPKNKGN